MATLSQTCSQQFQPPEMMRSRALSRDCSSLRTSRAQFTDCFRPNCASVRELQATELHKDLEGLASCSSKCRFPNSLASSLEPDCGKFEKGYSVTSRPHGEWHVQQKPTHFTCVVFAARPEKPRRMDVVICLPKDATTNSCASADRVVTQDQVAQIISQATMKAQWLHLDLRLLLSPPRSHRPPSFNG